MGLGTSSTTQSLRFSQIIGRMGFNRYLGFVLLTSMAWSLQPWFLSDQVLQLKNYSAALFLVFRYLLAIVFFVLIGAIYFSYFTKTRTEGVSYIGFLNKIHQQGLLGIAILMGLFMFLSRLFELRSYGENNDYAYFGMIFSILMVVFWDFKKWIFYALSKKRSNAISRFIALHLATKLESPIDLISWALQSVLVLLTALLFVYGIEGRLPELNGAVARSFAFALMSSLFLSLFYDFIAPIATVASKQSKSPFEDVFLLQMFAGSMLLFFAICWWLAETAARAGLGSPSSDQLGLSGAVQILANWSAYSYFLFVFGYVLVVTVVGYFAEHICLNLYDIKHRYRSWRIKGREWASITATFDPFISAALVIPALTWAGVTVGERPPKELGWVAVSGLGILGVGLLLFMRVWAQKVEGLRTKAFAKVSSRPFDTDQFVEMARVVLFKRSPLPPLELTEARFGDAFDAGDLEALHFILRFHGRNAFGFNQPDITVYTIKGGGYLFDADNQEGMLLWAKFRADLEEKLVRIHSLRDVYAMSEDLISLEGEAGDRISGLKRKLEEINGKEDDDKSFTFVAYKSFLVPEEATNAGAQGTSLRVSYLYRIQSDKPAVDFLKAVRNVMDREIADRAFRKTVGATPDEYELFSSKLTRQQLDEFGYEDDSLHIKGDTVIPYRNDDSQFIGLLKRVPERSYLVVDESVLMYLFESLDRKPLSDFIEASRNRYIVVRGDTPVSLFFRYTTQGSVDTSLSSLPCLEADMKVIGENRPHYQNAVSQLLWSARIRSTLSPQICFILDYNYGHDELSSLRSFFDVACIGMHPQYHRPDDLAEFQALLKKCLMPLVVFSSWLDNFSRGSKLLNGPQEISKYANVDPYLLADQRIDTSKEKWPFRRVLLKNQDSVSKAVASYCGLFSATESKGAGELDASIRYLKEFVDDYEKLREANTFQNHLYYLFDRIILAETSDRAA